MAHGACSILFLARNLLQAGVGFLFIAAVCACQSGGAGEGVSDIELIDQYEAERAQRGLAYAQEYCASCHAVEAGLDRSPNVAAPAFEELANRSDMSRLALATLLQSPHRNMPDLIVDTDDVGDISAYILLLKNGG